MNLLTTFLNRIIHPNTRIIPITELGLLSVIVKKTKDGTTATVTHGASGDLGYYEGETAREDALAFATSLARKNGWNLLRR